MFHAISHCYSQFCCLNSHEFPSEKSLIFHHERISGDIRQVFIPGFGEDFSKLGVPELSALRVMCTSKHL